MSRLPIEKFAALKTPFYYYDMELLRETLTRINKLTRQYRFHVHYALKANVDKRILRTIHDFGLGADCVSGNEILRAIQCKFDPSQIVFAGVGKSDDEINIALENDILCFNCESIQELEVIDQLAGRKNKSARVALRINPDVDPKTHRFITTGREENKFGIQQSILPEVVDVLKRLAHIEIIGIHFHVGSQVGDLTVFERLAEKANELNSWFDGQGIRLQHLNLGGGLGIDYVAATENQIADFEGYFAVFHRILRPYSGQEIHFELGRSLVAQCGTLISRVLFEKPGVQKTFLVIDAGMTELIRPALYEATHQIENINKRGNERQYDVVGPICESSDCFARNLMLPETRRGDLLAIYSCGAYAQVMSSRYNLRTPAAVYYSDKID